jgi:hypothetical protein
MTTNEHKRAGSSNNIKKQGASSTNIKIEAGSNTNFKIRAGSSTNKKWPLLTIFMGSWTVKEIKLKSTRPYSHKSTSRRTVFITLLSLH